MCFRRHVFRLGVFLREKYGSLITSLAHIVQLAFENKLFYTGKKFVPNFVL